MDREAVTEGFLGFVPSTVAPQARASGKKVLWPLVTVDVDL
jgi:hypothetical protein